MEATRSTWFPRRSSWIRFRNASRVARLVEVGCGPNPSVDLLRQLNDDPLGAADVAEAVAVLVAHQLAD